MTRIFAIGDIHGCYRSLDTLLGLVQPNTDDIVVTLGDYVDRGPMSSRVIDCLIELDHSTRLVPLRGNHECMMTLARNSLHDARRWMVNGGAETLDSYTGRCGTVANLEDIPIQHWEFLTTRLLPYWETKGFILFMAASIQISRWRNNPKLRCNGNNSRCRKPFITRERSLCAATSDRRVDCRPNLLLQSVLILVRGIAAG